MNAVVMDTPGDPGVLRTTRVPVPRPARGQVLVRVHAAMVSSLDLSVRSGAVPVDLPFLPGSDAAGEVLVVGPGVTEWSPGDRVVVVGHSMGLTRAGGYADYLTVSGAELHPIPTNVSFISSTSVGRSFSAAWTALFRDGRLGMNDRVAVIGAAHPIGMAAVQICHWKGSTVIAVSDGRHAPRLRALGAVRVISHSAPDLAARVRAGLGGRGATVVLNVTGSALPASVQMLDRNGRLVLTGGGDPQMLDVHPLIERRAHLIGSAPRIDAVALHQVLELLGEATFLPVIDSIYPLSKIAEAHRRAASQLTFGAVLLVPDHLYTSAEKVTQLGEEG